MRMKLVVIAGIDPSVSAPTGYALVEFRGQHGPRVLNAGVVKAPKKTKFDYDQERFIADEVLNQVKFGYSVFPDHIGLEVPKTDNALMHYTRRDGSQGTRPITSAQQWRLIGAIYSLYDVPPIVVTPGEVKSAVGLSPKEKRKPVKEVGQLTGYDFAGHSIKDQEAIADAVATAIAAKTKLDLEKMR